MKLFVKATKLFNEDIRINNQEHYINDRFWEIERNNGKRILVNSTKRKQMWIDMDLEHKGYFKKPRVLK